MNKQQKKQNENAPTVSFVSLGCFKNLVDTEVLGGLLEKKNIDPMALVDYMITDQQLGEIYSSYITLQAILILRHLIVVALPVRPLNIHHYRLLEVTVST